MNDYGTRHTDLAVKRAEWRLSRVYRQAQRDIDDKLKDWQERHAAREEKLRQQVKAGKMTQADFDAWMRGQVFQEKQWLARRDQIDEILLNADREAQRIVNEGKLGVFVDNANYMGYKIEQDVNVNVGFTLYDQNTVARLIKSDPQILPKPAPGVQKDKAYTYYNKLVNSAITQGIIQGESVQKIAHRIAETTGESCYKSAMRNARTAYTGAQNAGRIESMRQMKTLGINVCKQWVSAHDGHTRDAHLHLDGQIKEVDEPFDSDFNDGIMYPCDPNGAAANVYNCRCTLVEAFPEYQTDAMNQSEAQIEQQEQTAEPDIPQSDELERFGSALQGATNAAEFWMNMDADQMDAFNASGENIYDLFERLRRNAPQEMQELPEWKPDAPGGASSYSIFHDFTGSSIDVVQVPPRSDGWMADAEITGLIRVREGGFEEWRYTIGHEAGHQLSNMVPELGRTIIENPGGLLGRYNQRRGFFDGAFGEYSAEEAWADAVSAYINTPRQFEEQYPELYEAVDGFFRASPSARDFIERTYAAYRRAVGL